MSLESEALLFKGQIGPGTYPLLTSHSTQGAEDSGREGQRERERVRVKFMIHPESVRKSEVYDTHPEIAL